MTKPILSVENINVQYGKRTILHNFNMEISEGKITCLLGHNGAGKTSAIRTLLGLQESKSGIVCYCGTDIRKDFKHYKAQVGFVPDDDELFDDLTAYEYLSFLANARKIDREVFESVLQRYLDIFDLAENKNQMLKSFSHGMRRKVQIISALIHDPPLIIVDEPTNGLDPDMIILFKELLQLLRDTGKAILVSTHHLEFAQSIGDDIAIIKNGEMKIRGSKIKILEQLGVSNLEEAYIKVNLDPRKIEDIRSVFFHA